MSTPTHSLLATVPAALHDKANRLAFALGYQPEDGDTFSIRLTDGEDEFRAFLQFVMPSFIALLAAGKNGTYPPIQWSDFGLTTEDVAEVMGAIEANARPVDEGYSLSQHMAEFLAAPENAGRSLIEPSA